jgi:hypothetical protein
LYLTGTRTTVRVERCETVAHFRGESTHCEGSWPLPVTDRRGEGRIDYAGASTEGKRMSARTTGDHATVITAPELFWRDLLGAAVIAGEIAFLIAQTVKLREHRSSRP